MERKLLVLMLAIVMGFSGEEVASSQARDIACEDWLWVLASNEFLFEARLVAYDPCTGDVVQEVLLPPNLGVVSAQWSPDGRYIATVLGGYRPLSGIVGMGIGLFEADGDAIMVREYPILNVLIWTPARITWAADSSRAYFAVAGPPVAGYHSAATTVMSLDPANRDVSLETEVDASPRLIYTWDWIPGGCCALNLYQPPVEEPPSLFLVRLQPSLDAVLIAENAIAFDVASNHVLYVTELPEQTPEYHLIRLDEKGVIALGSRDELPYQGRRLRTYAVYGLSDDASVLAFRADHLDPSISITPFTRLPLFVLEWDTGQVTQMEGEYLAVDEIVWSPNGAFFAARTCESSLAVNPPYDCQVRVFSREGGVTLVPTGAEETRNPMWMPASRARP